MDTNAPVPNCRSDTNMRRWLTIILLLVWVGVAGAQTTPPMCSITGNVANPDGTPYVGVIKFYNPIVQIINNIPINPLQVSTGTNASGVIQPISLPQGAFFQVTICPSASMSSGCAATYTAIVPAMASANFGNMSMGVNLTPGITASSLSVSGTTSLASTTISTLPLTFGSGTQLADEAGAGNANLVTINMTTGAIGTGVPPVLQFNSPTTSTAQQYNLGQIAFGSLATASTDKRGAIVSAVDNNHTNTSVPYGALTFAVANGAPAVVNMQLYEDGGLAVTPTMTAGSDQGPGTINVSGGYYVNGSKIDYAKEIAWTPVLEFGGATTGITYQSGFPYGYYWRVGPLVHVVWGIYLSSKGTATGAATMCGLPFHIPNDGGNFGFFPLINFGTLPGLTGGLPGITFTGSGNCVAITGATYTNGTIGNLTNTHFGGGDNIQGSFTYATDDP